MTTAAAITRRHLIEDLPPVRGKLQADAPLANQSWFRVGGHAEVLFKPADTDDLASMLAGLAEDVPVTVLGVASNIIIRDGGVPGLVIRLGPQHAMIQTDGAQVTAGAAALDVNVARAAQTAGIAGLEFMSGIPGSVGGGLRMNAGAYGHEFKDVLRQATAVDRHGKIHCVESAALNLSYRHSDAPEDWIFTQAVFAGTQGDPAFIRARMQEIQDQRGKSQPIHEKTGGSTFANPDGHKAWQLIDAAGCRGLRIGGAMMSEHHCNFMINADNATAADLEALGEEVRRRVLAHSGVTLRWEIKRIGIPLTERNAS